MVDLLLERGASVTCKTKNGLTPLHMSSQGDHVDCARLLLYHKAPIDEVTVVSKVLPVISAVCLVFILAKLVKVSCNPGMHGPRTRSSI